MKRNVWELKLRDQQRTNQNMLDLIKADLQTIMTLLNVVETERASREMERVERLMGEVARGRHAIRHFISLAAKRGLPTAPLRTELTRLANRQRKILKRLLKKPI